MVIHKKPALPETRQGGANDPRQASEQCARWIDTFPECFCDLHSTGGVGTPNLCECSRQSILYVGKEIWGKNHFAVLCEGTILSGAPKCFFRVIFEEE